MPARHRCLPGISPFILHSPGGTEAQPWMQRAQQKCLWVNEDLPSPGGLLPL